MDQFEHSKAPLYIEVSLLSKFGKNLCINEVIRPFLKISRFFFILVVKLIESIVIKDILHPFFNINRFYNMGTFYKNVRISSKNLNYENRPTASTSVW